MTQLVSALSRDTPAFGSPLNVSRAMERSLVLDVNAVRPKAGPGDNGPPPVVSPSQAVQRQASGDTSADADGAQLLGEPKRTAVSTSPRMWWGWRSGPAGPPVFGNLKVPNDLSSLVGGPASDQSAGELTLSRITAALDVLEIRHLSDGSGSVLALWERHALLIAIEGPDDEILVVRVRLHATVPPELSEMAYRAVNEWNHTRRFLKAYIGDPTESGQLPIYGELQIPFRAGTLDSQLWEILDMAAAVATTFSDWLYNDGGLLL